jgi:hypothetical protein
VDINGILEQLYTRREKLRQVIAELEQLQHISGPLSIASVSVSKRRGRKSMGPEERQQVSKRIKQYWAKRRAAR